jgi:hypothetical protein
MLMWISQVLKEPLISCVCVTHYFVFSISIHDLPIILCNFFSHLIIFLGMLHFIFPFIPHNY